MKKFLNVMLRIAGVVVITAVIGIVLSSCDFEAFWANLTEEEYGQVEIKNDSNSLITVTLMEGISIYRADSIPGGQSKTFDDIPAYSSLQIVVSISGKQYSSDIFTVKNYTVSYTFTGNAVIRN